MKAGFVDEQVVPREGGHRNKHRNMCVSSFMCLNDLFGFLVCPPSSLILLHSVLDVVLGFFLWRHVESVWLTDWCWVAGVAHTGCRVVLGLSATNDVLMELRSWLQPVASFDFRLFNVWPVVASLFLQLCWWIQRGWMKHETAHEWENWRNISGCWCMPLLRPRPLSQSVPLPISNEYWKTSMLAHQSRSNSFSKNWKRIGRSLTKRRNGRGRCALAETSQVQVTCVRNF